ncbi:MAG: AAA family ATPase [Desulfobacteraceae bacterium]|nr:AAA family ATPase [Desulfobacteraceae bacterium]
MSAAIALKKQDPASEIRFRCTLCKVLFIDPEDGQGGPARCPICDSVGRFDSNFSNHQIDRMVSFTGSHGVGKTTSVLDKGRELKISLPHRTVGVLSENVIDSPYPINQQTTPESQLWIYTNQIQAELKFLSKYDVTVCDRTALDAVAYSYVAGFGQMASAMFDLFRSHCHVYGQIYFKTVRRNNYLVSDGIRDSSDSKFQAAVETVLLQLYQKLGVRIVLI